MIKKSSHLIDVHVEITSSSEKTLHLSLPDRVDGWIVSYIHSDKVIC